ncbi:hypothetical protein [Streptomyces sp. NPDC001652]|uniref:hypothetical protein n=1 Tax=Streptomyces sp. NPDC001652 TaxID=3154393 RepID=UPI00331A0B2D
MSGRELETNALMPLNGGATEIRDATLQVASLSDSLGDVLEVLAALGLPTKKDQYEAIKALAAIEESKEKQT